MAIICWGNLAKSADDTQRIEQSIGSYIEVHNEDPNAHQVEGSSLYMHRVNERLDHALGSIDLAYLAKDKVTFLSAFESFDGWDLSAATSVERILNSGINTSAVANNIAYLQIARQIGTMQFKPAKNPFFQTTVRVFGSTDVLATFGFGADYTTATYDKMGFKVSNSTLYAYWTSGGVEHTYEIEGITTTDNNIYRCYIDNDEGMMYFFVNGVLKYQTDSDLPITNSDYIFTYFIKTLTTEIKGLVLCDLLLTEDR